MSISDFKPTTEVGKAHARGVNFGISFSAENEIEMLTKLQDMLIGDIWSVEDVIRRIDDHIRMAEDRIKSHKGEV